MKIKFRKMLLCLTSILALGIFMGGVSAENVGDMDSNISGDSGSGCAGKDSCWLYAGGDTTVYGIRISIVDGNGNLVSGTKSIDYLGRDVWTYKVNNNTNYYRYTGSKINRIAYLFGNASSSDMSRHDGTKIAKTWPAELGVLPDIYDADDPKNSNAAQQIQDIILGLDEADLQKLFFDDLGYSIPASNSMLKNHYMIVEPLTMVSAYNKKQIFYGTYYELTEKLINTYNRENSNDSGKSWIATVLDMYLPLSMYITGKENIEGYENGTYFNGRLKVANDRYTWYQSSKNRTRVITTYVKNGSIGFGIGIIWLNDLIEQPTCDWSADASATTGPNGIVCCEYIANNLSEYGKTKEQFYNEHPECRKTCDYGNKAHFTEGGPNGEDCCEYFLNQGYSSDKLLKDHPICGTTILKKCKPFPTINNASCHDYDANGNIKDIGKNEDEWTCIYASAYSNDTDWQNYFLKGKVTENGIDKCSVYCREEVSYGYPIKGAMKALAGTYFTINRWGASDYGYFEIPQNTSLGFSAANLGSINTTVTRECRIYAEKEENASACKQPLKEALNVNNLKAPTITFSYEQPEYNNPSVTLHASNAASSSPNYSTIKTGQSYTSSKSYRYSLKTSDSYRYVVIEDGISYKNEPEGRQYYEMDEHLPIHFNYSNDKIFYEINITDLGLDNFNSLVLEGKSMPTTFKTSIET